jgi:hypothetical protein
LTNWASWGGNPVSFKRDESNQIEGLILQLRVNHGVFDFRTLEGPQEARISMDYFSNNIFVQRAVSTVFQILPKPRTSSSRQPCVALSWQDTGIVEAFESKAITHNQSENFIITKTPDRATLDLLSLESPLLSGSAGSIQSFEDAYLQDSDQQYMVLYNGNAEVVGNFRALNFYKASDINIKEDVRLLVEDVSPREILLKIDGVAYKFKQGVHASVNKRFVGFIAQQVESVVPDSVQLIDGILHVDYESLIPYMNESIRANFNDLKDIKSKNEALRQTLDQVYEQFVVRDRKLKQHKNNDGRPPGGDSSKSRMHPAWKGLIAIFALAVALMVSLQVVSHMEKIKDKNNPELSPISPSPPPPPSPPIPILPTPPDGPTTEEYRILKELYEATDGPNWFNSTNWLNKNVPECEWHGVKCFKDLGQINLSSNNLRGTIPVNLGRIKNFVDFNFANNSLHGVIPSSFSWFHLFSLRLQDNQLTGTIPPEIFAVNTLALVNVSNNMLSGSIPNGIGSNLFLQIFCASHNQLTGTIPSYQANYFDVSYNLLEGSLPQLSPTQASALMVLNLEHNNLSGDASLLSNLTTIIQITIAHNNFTGTLLISQSQLQSLYALDASYTLIDGLSEARPLPGFPKLASCNLTHVPFKCPLPAWAIKCGATCT